MMKFLKYGAAALVLAVLGLVAAVQLRWDRTFEAPATNFKASTDSAVIARGSYLAYGPAHCADCHTPPEQRERRRAGEQLPLAGGFEFKIPPGAFCASWTNQTSASGPPTSSWHAGIAMEFVMIDAQPFPSWSSRSLRMKMWWH